MLPDLGGLSLHHDEALDIGAPKRKDPFGPSGGGDGGGGGASSSSRSATAKFGPRRSPANRAADQAAAEAAAKAALASSSGDPPPRFAYQIPKSPANKYPKVTDADLVPPPSVSGGRSPMQEAYESAQTASRTDGVWIHPKFGPVPDWDMSQVTKLPNLFNNILTQACREFNQDLSKWDVSNVTEGSSTFYDCHAFEGKGLDKWRMPKLTKAEQMFRNCASFNPDLSGWDVSSLESGSRMFFNCKQFEGKGLDKWQTSSLKNMSEMFAKCGIGLSGYAEHFNPSLEGWDVSRVFTMRQAFQLARGFRGRGLDKWQPDVLYTATRAFESTLLSEVNLSGWDMSVVRHADHMFAECLLFDGNGLEKWHLPNVVDARNMFFKCEDLDFDASNWSMESAYALMSMFEGCKNFKGVGCDKWTLQPHCAFADIFKGCKALVSNPVNDWYRAFDRNANHNRPFGLITHLPGQAQVTKTHANQIILQPSAQARVAAVAKLFDHAYYVNLCRDLRDDTGRPFTKLLPVGVFDIVYGDSNPLKQLYLSTRAMMQHQPDKACGKYMPDEECTRTDFMKDDVAWASDNMPPLDPSINEKFLCHGLKNEHLDPVIQKGFDRRKGKVAAYGPAIYQAEDPGKSDCYCEAAGWERLNARFDIDTSDEELKNLLTRNSIAYKPNQDGKQRGNLPEPNTFYMLITRTILGCANHCENGKFTGTNKTDLLGDRVYTERKHQIAEPYDSLIVEHASTIRGSETTGNAFREFLVQNERQILPVIIVAYVRANVQPQQPNKGRALDCDPLPRWVAQLTKYKKLSPIPNGLTYDPNPQPQVTAALMLIKYIDQTYDPAGNAPPPRYDPNPLGQVGDEANRRRTVANVPGCLQKLMSVINMPEDRAVDPPTLYDLYILLLGLLSQVDDVAKKLNDMPHFLTSRLAQIMFYQPTVPITVDRIRQCVFALTRLCLANEDAQGALRAIHHSANPNESFLIQILYFVKDGPFNSDGQKMALRLLTLLADKTKDDAAAAHVRESLRERLGVLTIAEVMQHSDLRPLPARLHAIRRECLHLLCQIGSNADNKDVETLKAVPVVYGMIEEMANVDDSDPLSGLKPLAKEVLETVTVDKKARARAQRQATIDWADAGLPKGPGGRVI